MARKLYEDTGMYIDWPQLKHLPNVDTIIDVGIGLEGTEDIWDRFHDSRLILIDPLEECASKAKELLGTRKFDFHEVGLGSSENTAVINIESTLGRSTLYDVTDINYEADPIEKRSIKIKRLDDLLAPYPDLGSIGIKIDTEGYELEVLKGSTDTLQQTDFVLAEVRHNHASFTRQYTLAEFCGFMADCNFILSRIMTAKPLIADLCFERTSTKISRQN